MIACMRARALSHARIRRPPLVRPLPTSTSWVVRFSSETSREDNSSTGSTTSSGSVDGAAADGAATTTPGPGGADFDPSSLIPPVPPAGAESWSAAAQQFVSDLPGSVTPLVADAGMYLLHGVLNAGVQIMGGVQAGMEGVHHLTGLPWWATIAVATVGVKISLLPVVVYQARHTDRMRMAWPEIQVLRDHLAATLDKIPQRRVLARWQKYRIFFSGTRGILGLHGTHPLGLMSTPLVNLPVFLMFVWSIRGMLRDASIPGLDTGGILWFVDLTATDSSLMLPIMSTLLTYSALELAKMKDATGWIKFFQDGMQTFIIMMLPWVSTFPQGVFMYWIPSSAFQMGQTLAMRNGTVRDFIGLQPLGVAPRPKAPPSSPSPSPAPSPSSQQAITAGVIPENKTSAGQ